MNGYDALNGADDLDLSPDINNKKTAEQQSESFSDGQFTIKVSQNMALRNQLRSGLVEAVGKNQTQIPMFVSWPNWLDDGIVCLYARDLHRIIHDTVKQTVHELGKTFGIEALTGEAMFDAAPTPEPSTDKQVPSAEEHEITPEDFPVAKETEAESPKPVSPPELSPAREKPVTDQDIADQLFAQLKKGKKK